MHNANLPLSAAHDAQGSVTTFPRVASRQPKRICFLRESPPVSTSDPASIPSLQGRVRFAGIICNLSSIVEEPGSRNEIWFKYFGLLELGKLGFKVAGMLEASLDFSGSGDGDSRS